MTYVLLILGFVLIIVASDVLVDASSSVAIKLKIPTSLIASTIVAFGTCAPELAISFNSMVAGNGDLALANVIGSCIINIVLIIGVASIFNPIRIKKNVIRKDLPILLITTSIFAIIFITSLFKSSPYLSRIDGLLLLGTFSFFGYHIYKLATRKFRIEKKTTLVYNYRIAIVLIILALIAIGYSSDLIVSNAVLIASTLGISEKIITMFVIVIGTSLPELVMTVTSAKKKEFDFAVGNIIGTNIFNICIVLGLPMFVSGGIPIHNFNIIDILVVLIAVLVLYFFSKSDKKLTRIEGIFMLSIFILYYGYLLLG